MSSRKDKKEKDKKEKDKKETANKEPKDKKRDKSADKKVRDKAQRVRIAQQEKFNGKLGIHVNDDLLVEEIRHPGAETYWVVGDQILEVNGIPVHSKEEYTKEAKAVTEPPFEFTVLRRRDADIGNHRHHDHHDRRDHHRDHHHHRDHEHRDHHHARDDDHRRDQPRRRKVRLGISQPVKFGGKLGIHVTDDLIVDRFTDDRAGAFWVVGDQILEVKSKPISTRQEFKSQTHDDMEPPFDFTVLREDGLEPTLAKEEALSSRPTPRSARRKEEREEAAKKIQKAERGRQGRKEAKEKRQEKVKKEKKEKDKDRSDKVDNKASEKKRQKEERDKDDKRDRDARKDHSRSRSAEKKGNIEENRKAGEKKTSNRKESRDKEEKRAKNPREKDSKSQSSNEPRPGKERSKSREKKEREEAAKKIQRIERGRQGRKEAKGKRQEKHEEAEIERGRQGREEAERKRKEKQDEAAKKIQKIQRGRQGRKEAKLKRQEKDAKEKGQDKATKKFQKAEREEEKEKKADEASSVQRPRVERSRSSMDMLVDWMVSGTAEEEEALDRALKKSAMKAVERRRSSELRKAKVAETAKWEMPKRQLPERPLPVKFVNLYCHVECAWGLPAPPYSLHGRLCRRDTYVNVTVRWCDASGTLLNAKPLAHRRTSVCYDSTDPLWQETLMLQIPMDIVHAGPAGAALMICAEVRDAGTGMEGFTELLGTWQAALVQIAAGELADVRCCHLKTAASEASSQLKACTGDDYLVLDSKDRATLYWCCNCWPNPLPDGMDVVKVPFTPFGSAKRVKEDKAKLTTHTPEIEGAMAMVPDAGTTGDVTGGSAAPVAVADTVELQTSVDELLIKDGLILTSNAAPEVHERIMSLETMPTCMTEVRELPEVFAESPGVVAVSDVSFMSESAKFQWDSAPIALREHLDGRWDSGLESGPEVPREELHAEHLEAAWDSSQAHAAEDISAAWEASPVQPAEVGDSSEGSSLSWMFSAQTQAMSWNTKRGASRENEDMGQELATEDLEKQADPHMDEQDELLHATALPAGAGSASSSIAARIGARRWSAAAAGALSSRALAAELAQTRLIQIEADDSPLDSSLSAVWGRRRDLTKMLGARRPSMTKKI